MAHVFQVQNLRCGGCATTITRGLEAAGLRVRGVRPDDQAVEVDDAPDALLAEGAAILRRLGYPLQGEGNGLLDGARSVVSCAIGKVTG